MEPLFALKFYIVAIALATLPCMLAGRLLGRFFARHYRRRVRRRFGRFGALIPAGTAIYVLLWIIAMALFGAATGRGFGDDLEIPLNNGFQWSAPDTPGVASVFDKKDRNVSRGQGLNSIPGSDSTTFDNVLSLQQSGDWLAGSYLEGLDPTLDNPHWKPDHWFLFNTRTHQRFDAGSEVELQQIAAQRGVVLHLESSPNFYDDYRYRWYDIAVSSLLCLPGILMLFWIYKKARQLLRNEREAARLRSSMRRG
jgi:hypothetical protein